MLLVWSLQVVPRAEVVSFCRAEHGFAVEFVSITILTLKYPDVSILHVPILEKQIKSVGKQLF